METNNLYSKKIEFYIGYFFKVSKYEDGLYRYCIIDESMLYSPFYRFLSSSNRFNGNESDAEREYKIQSFVSKLSAIGYLLSPKKEGETQSIIVGLPHPSNKKRVPIGLSLFGNVISSVEEESRTLVRSDYKGIKIALKGISSSTRFLMIDDMLLSINKEDFIKLCSLDLPEAGNAKVYLNSGSAEFSQKVIGDDRFHILYFGELYNQGGLVEKEDVLSDRLMARILTDCIGIYETFGLISANTDIINKCHE